MKPLVKLSYLAAACAMIVATFAIIGPRTAHALVATLVQVVNTPNVNIANTPVPVSGNVNATISGTPSVNVNGMPAVNVASISGNVPVVNPLDGSGNPIPLVNRDADNPGRNAFDVKGFCVFTAVFNNACQVNPIFSVPANHVAVVQEVSGICTTNSGTAPEDVSLGYTGSSGSSILTLLPGPQVPFTSSQVKSIYSEKVTAYALGGASGSQIGFFVDTATPQTSSDICDIDVVGYLVAQ